MSRHMILQVVLLSACAILMIHAQPSGSNPGPRGFRFDLNKEPPDEEPPKSMISQEVQNELAEIEEHMQYSYDTDLNPRILPVTEAELNDYKNKVTNAIDVMDDFLNKNPQARPDPYRKKASEIKRLLEEFKPNPFEKPRD